MFESRSKVKAPLEEFLYSVSPKYAYEVGYPVHVIVPLPASVKAIFPPPTEAST